MRRRQRRKSSAAFCVKSASCPPTELSLSPGPVFPAFRQVFGQCGKKSTYGRALWGGHGCRNVWSRVPGAAGGGKAHQLKSERERLEAARRGEWPTAVA